MKSLPIGRVLLALFVILFLIMHISSSISSINARFDGVSDARLLYVSAFMMLISLLLLLNAFYRHSRDSDSFDYVLSFLFYILSQLIAEYGVHKAGLFYQRYLPYSSMFIAMIPSLMGLALYDRSKMKRSGSHSIFALSAASLISLSAVAMSIYTMSDYLWMGFVFNNTNIFSVLAVAFSVTASICGITAFFAKNGKTRAITYILIIVSMILVSLMNIISYDHGSIVVKIANGEFSSWWRRLPPYYYVRGFLFSTAGSYPFAYLLFSCISLKASDKAR